MVAKRRKPTIRAFWTLPLSRFAEISYKNNHPGSIFPHLAHERNSFTTIFRNNDLVDKPHGYKEDT
jgi:hypothetical protein